MKRKLMIAAALLLLCSCTTIRIAAPKAGTVAVNADKTITTTPSLTASPSGNTVPVSTLP